MPFATTPDGVSIAYQVRGDGRPPLVLLAGQANNHHWWDGVRDDFHGIRSTITFDYRGTGDSDEPTATCSTQQFAGDVVAVLDDLGVDRADVYGTSMGGRVAQLLAASHPERVSKLVLGCSSPGGRHSIERGTDVRRALAAPDPADARRALIGLMYTPAWPGPYRTVGDPTMSAHARSRHLVASKHHDSWDALLEIRAPTLVLHGTDDLLNPTANAPLLAGRIPGARLELIDGARHAYFEEFRAIASPIVLDFLKD